ncbi:MAG: hypothetical protein KJ050_12260 [Candidatus Omnitrophica bacterium]|nr:hypothetical protein [bacterium]MCL4735698.1 hypothetical protein [Candidatus Omnitrophota bacterium]NUP94320.1 hypothetical protein [Candidatus Omnitrophota bacterium]
MNPNIFEVLLLSIGCGLLAGLIHYISLAWNMTTPRRLGKTAHPLPPSSEGGLAFLFGVLICLAYILQYLEEDLWLTPEEMKSRHLGLGASLAWVWGLGRWGDRDGYSHVWSLSAVASGALILALTGFQMHTLRVSGEIHQLGLWSIPATVLWLVVISEFIRLFDGLDGILVCITIGIVLLQYFYVLPFEEGYARALCFCTIPPLLGLLPWRLYPCRIELRGIGAFLPGFMIGAITLVGREKAFTTKAVVLPGIVFIAVFSLFCLWLLEQHLFLPSRKKIDSETESRKIIIKN